MSEDQQKTTLPVSPDTVTVLGYRVKPDSPAWRGLNLAAAERYEASVWGADHHLCVPWWHPDDGPPPDPPEMYYRVRPRRKAWRFVREGDEWRISTK